MSKILKKIFGDGSSQKVFQKFNQFQNYLQGTHFEAFCTFWWLFDILKRLYNDILRQCWNFL